MILIWSEPFYELIIIVVGSCMVDVSVKVIRWIVVSWSSGHRLLKEFYMKFTNL